MFCSSDSFSVLPMAPYLQCCREKSAPSPTLHYDKSRQAGRQAAVPLAHHSTASFPWENKLTKLYIPHCCGLRQNKYGKIHMARMVPLIRWLTVGVKWLQSLKSRLITRILSNHCFGSGKEAIYHYCINVQRFLLLLLLLQHCGHYRCDDYTRPSDYILPYFWNKLDGLDITMGI